MQLTINELSEQTKDEIIFEKDKTISELSSALKDSQTTILNLEVIYIYIIQLA